MNLRAEWWIALRGLTPDRPSQSLLLFILAPVLTGLIQRFRVPIFFHVTREALSKNRPDHSCCQAVNQDPAYWRGRGGRGKKEEEKDKWEIHKDPSAELIHTAHYLTFILHHLGLELTDFATNFTSFLFLSIFTLSLSEQITSSSLLIIKGKVHVER